MKHSGNCNKCGSVEILIFRGNEQWAHVQKRKLISWLTIDQSVYLDRYVCERCGYSEYWIDNLDNIRALKKHFNDNFRPFKRIWRDDFIVGKIMNEVIVQIARLETKMINMFTQKDKKIAELEKRIEDLENGRSFGRGRYDQPDGPYPS